MSLPMGSQTLAIEWVRAHPQKSSVSSELLSQLEGHIGLLAFADRFFHEVSALQEQMLQGDVAAERLYLLARHVAFISDATSRRDAAVFFSGAHKTSAEYFILNNPHYQAIHCLPVGLFLEKLNLFGHTGIAREDTYDVWNIAARRYADAASGNVTLVLNGQIDSEKGDLSVLDTELSPFATFRSIELPHLLANDRVQTINHRDKWQFRFLATDNFDVFAPVERARDRERATLTRDTKIKQKTLKL